jgi:hypothetical protein
MNLPGPDFGGRIESMPAITVELDDDLARHVEESARREQKSISEWVRDRVKPDMTRAAAFAALEARALANGYPPGWITLFGSLADDESFVAPARGASRPVAGLDQLL